jgi:hypothetical protein
MYTRKRKFDATGHCGSGLHGRPKILHRTLKQPHKMFLFMMSAVDTTRTAELAEDLFEQFGLAVSEETVRQELHELRLTNKVVAPLDKRAFTPDNVLSAPPWVGSILFTRRLVWLSSCKCWMYARVCGSAFLAFTECAAGLNSTILTKAR